MVHVGQSLITSGLVIFFAEDIEVVYYLGIISLGWVKTEQGPKNLKALTYELLSFIL